MRLAHFPALLSAAALPLTATAGPGRPGGTSRPGVITGTVTPSVMPPAGSPTPSPSPLSSPTPTPPEAASPLSGEPQSPRSGEMADTPGRLVLPGNEPALSEQERLGIGITRRWQDRSLETMAPEPGPDGAVVFTFGQSMPSIVCAPLQITDVALQPGERVRDLVAGDTSKDWFVHVAPSGEGDEATQHVVLKASQVGLSTTVVIMTTRRTYHLVVRSSGEGYMHEVRFKYPDEPAPGEAPVHPDLAAAQAVAAAHSTAPAPSPTPGRPVPRPKANIAMVQAVKGKPESRKVAFNEGKGVVAEPPPKDRYVIRGEAPWRPLQAYHDGKRTFIELPRGLSSTEAPVLYGLRKGGFLGLGKKPVVLNFRLHGHWLVADGVLDRAELLTGTGSGRQSVTLTREAVK